MIVFGAQPKTTLDCPSLPFQGGWIGSVSYALGQFIEPTAVASCRPVGGARPDQPIFEMAWCPDALIGDTLTGKWYEIGIPPVRLADISGSSTSDGESPYDKSLVFTLGEFETEQDRQVIETHIADVIDYIREGDIFQANLSQRFGAAFSGSTRGLLLAAIERNPSWYQAYLELPCNRTLLSLSPELFLQYHPASRQITTRPIKGTAASTVSPNDLLDSAKDEAELHMIVDLMRNDIGRVCCPGSVVVTENRVVETHHTVHHGVSTITGTLRSDSNPMDLLRATMPGGSITGAPKIRAMQIIDELEPFERGPFFGAIGYISRDKKMCLNLAIRTLFIEGNRATYVAGAGIVADSDPTHEYEEMILKAEGVKRMCSNITRSRTQQPVAGHESAMPTDFRGSIIDRHSFS